MLMHLRSRPGCKVRKRSRANRNADPALLAFFFLSILYGCIVGITGTWRAAAAEQPEDVPAWLKRHVGERDGQIAGVVLQRARTLYLQKTSRGRIKNPCYFAMDATRPHDLGGGKLGKRFYIVCEPNQLFRAISAGHGSGRNLKDFADFANGRRCARNFSNAMGSRLTAGGAYVTGNGRITFKGYYRDSATREVVLSRWFVPFDGEGEVSNARQREIGGHAAVTLKNICLQKDPKSPYADGNGYVPFGQLVKYAGGRSDGCTSWAPSDIAQIIAIVRQGPTTLYIYPESKDIDAVARAVAASRSLSHVGLYWNASCLKEIQAPRFWPKEVLEPVIARYDESHAPPRPVPVCKSR